MEFLFWMECCFVLNIYLTFYVSCGKQSKLEKKVNALDHLFRGEMYLVNEKLEAGRQERENLIDRFNETLEYLENLGGDNVGKTVAVYQDKQNQSNLETISDKLESTSLVVDELSESLIRTKRGMLQEKKARKSDASAILEKLDEIQEKQNELAKNVVKIVNIQDGLVNTVDNIVNIQDGLVNRVDNIVNIQDGLVNRVDQIVNIQDGLVNTVNNIVTIQDGLFNTVNNIVNKVDGIIDTQAGQANKVKELIINSSEVLQNTTEKLGNKLDAHDDVLSEFSERTQIQLGELSDTTINHIVHVNKTAQEIKQITQVVALRLYCSDQQNFNNCLERALEALRYRRIRLKGGATKYEGRVEIKYEDQWGTVCDDDWDDKDAKVVCRMLGFFGQATALQGGHSFGQGAGKILLDQVNCDGHEISILQCERNAIGDHNCNHSEDAGVRCQP